MDVQLSEEAKDKAGVVPVTELVRFRDFSKQPTHHPSNPTDFLLKQGSTTEPKVTVFKAYPNGDSNANLGHVCVTARHIDQLRNFRLTYIVTVVDSSGNHRFPQTFTIPQTSQQSAPHRQEVHRFISRETLLSDAAGLLPDDTLTLQFKIYAVPVSDDIGEILDSSFEQRKEKDEIYHYLLLDSPLVKVLAAESSYFEGLLRTPMMESKTRHVYIDTHAPFLEHQSLRTIGQYFLGAQRISFSSIEDIFSLYVVADKYDIPVIMEVCLGFLKLCLSDHDAGLVRRSAEVFLVYSGKEELWNRLDDAMRTYWGTGESGDGEASNSLQMLGAAQEIRGRSWTYWPDRTTLSENLNFVVDGTNRFQPIDENSALKDGDKSSFDFYN